MEIKKEKASRVGLERILGKCKQGGMLLPLAMGLSKCHKFSVITDEEDDDEEAPQLFIAEQCSAIRQGTFIDLCVYIFWIR